jgi:hypothetical protein
VTRSMEVVDTSPSVPRRDDEGTCGQDGELPPIASTGPRLGGSTHGYTSWHAPNVESRQCVRHHRGRLKHFRCRLKLTPHTLTNSGRKPCRSTDAPARLRGYTRGCASAPPRNSIAARKEERPISRRQPLRVLDGYLRRGSGATDGDSNKGPLITGEEPIFV